MREFRALARLAASQATGLDVLARSEGGLGQLLLRPGSAVGGFACWFEGGRKRWNRSFGCCWSPKRETSARPPRHSPGALSMRLGRR